MGYTGCEAAGWVIQDVRQLGGWKFLIEKAILDGALQNTFMFKMRLFISCSSFLVYTMC